MLLLSRGRGRFGPSWTGNARPPRDLTAAGGSGKDDGDDEEEECRE